MLALDGDKRPCRVKASNAGHALFSGIALPERAAQVVDALMASSSFCGWGVRTVASTEARYNPMSYHNGSVWPHDNALIASGFARYGFRREAAQVFEGLFRASTYVDLRRLPELLCGFPRKQNRGPTFYPVACAPQAWAAAAPLSLIQSCLGLTFDSARSPDHLFRAGPAELPGHHHPEGPDGRRDGRRHCAEAFPAAGRRRGSGPPRSGDRRHEDLRLARAERGPVEIRQDPGPHPPRLRPDAGQGLVDRQIVARHALGGEAGFE